MIEHLQSKILDNSDITSEIEDFNNRNLGVCKKNNVKVSNEKNGGSK